MKVVEVGKEGNCRVYGYHQEDTYDASETVRTQKHARLVQNILLLLPWLGIVRRMSEYQIPGDKDRDESKYCGYDEAKVMKDQAALP